MGTWGYGDMEEMGIWGKRGDSIKKPQNPKTPKPKNLRYVI
jgi:hypothetical protein